MAPVTISIPCASHRSCTSHKHGAGMLSSSRSLTTYKGTQEISLSANSIPTDISRPQEPKVTSSEISRFELLPQELFLIIVASLTPGDKACLALASRAMTRALGSDAWTTAKSWNRTDFNGFLGVLVRDLSEEYWHCVNCVVLHRRSTTKEVAEAGWLRTFNGLKSLLRPQREVLEEPSFQVQVRGTPIYTLSFACAQAIMDRHIQGKGQGRCIDTLRCSGIFKYPHLSEIGNMVLRYRMEPKILLDRLLLRATYTWEVEDWKERLATPKEQRPIVQDARIDPELLIKNMDLFVCKHMDAITVLRAVSYRPLTREPLRCSYCPTQFWVRYATGAVMDYSTELQVWHNLGPCQNQNEERWTHIVSGRDERNEYGWKKWRKGRTECADEDVREAYQWITIKTVETYEKRYGKVGRGCWGNYFYSQPDNRDSRMFRSVAETLL